jgi:hypothetical protein
MKEQRLYLLVDEFGQVKSHHDPAGTSGRQYFGMMTQLLLRLSLRAVTAGGSRRAIKPQRYKINSEFITISAHS